MFARRPTLSLAFVILTAGCSSSSSAPVQAGDDSGNGALHDSGGSANGDDATVSTDSGSRSDSGHGGADGSLPQDGGTASPFDASTSGDAGVAAVCAGLCGSLEHCATILDAGPAQPCHCDVAGTQLLRADYVQALTDCVSSTISSHCAVVAADGGTASVVGTCEKTVAGSINPTPTTAAFCKNLGLSLCSGAITDCVAQVFTYGDPTITAAANCLPEVPDAAVDGGCNAFAQCLNTAFTP